MVGVSVPTLVALCAILTTFVAETACEEIVECYQSIGDVDLKLRCDDRDSVIVRITQFTYSRSKPRSTECNEDDMDHGCTFYQNNNTYVRRLCLGQRKCRVYIDPEDTDTRQRPQRGCRPNFQGGVIVHLRFECRKHEHYDEEEEDDEEDTHSQIQETTEDEIFNCYDRFSNVNIEIKCDDRDSVITEISHIAYGRRNARTQECNSGSVQPECMFKIVDNSYVRGSCIGQRKCRVEVDPDNMGTVQRPPRRCRPDFDGKMIINVRYECRKTTRREDYKTTTVKTTKRDTYTPPPPPPFPPQFYPPPHPPIYPRFPPSTTTTTQAPPVSDSAKQVSKKLTHESSTKTVVIVGCTVGVLGVTIGAAISFLLFRRSSNRELKMRPASFVARNRETDYEGGPYVNENVYEDAHDSEHPSGQRVGVPHLSQPHIPDSETPPPLPSRTPSTGELPVVAVHTVPGEACAPQTTTSNGTDNDAEHAYLKLISVQADVVSS